MTASIQQNCAIPSLERNIHYSNSVGVHAYVRANVSFRATGCICVSCIQCGQCVKTECTIAEAQQSQIPQLASPASNQLLLIVK